MVPVSIPRPTGNLTTEIIGVWLLKTREDWTTDGQKRIDPTLGENPIGILAYAARHFTAQFMKRDRSDQSQMVSYAGTNNTVALGGYDAYFGTYEIDELSGKVKHTLTGSINENNIGISVWRDLRISGNQLIIQLETTTIEGEPIIRTLTWQRDSK
ncbi:MAG: lipocalin-like domain-containing protein [Saprospiraceae bacterium]|nr:lipocalin-like domain-containing protein [Saprospiraceae bacterium]HPG06531.1 lipocalin-like domain-containing protein [Saprospiraceae bacterium]